MLDFTDFLAMMAIEDAHKEYEREREREERNFYSSDDKDNDDEGNKIFAASWAVYFKDGEVEYTSRYNSNNYSVRCVSSEF